VQLVNVAIMVPGMTEYKPVVQGLIVMMVAGMTE